jgi:hypothetical protein
MSIDYISTEDSNNSAFWEIARQLQRIADSLEKEVPK